MSNTVTYTNPQTFCRCVVEDIAARGWKIQTKRTGKLLDFILPDNTRAASLDALTALLALCRTYADKFKLPVSYNPSYLLDVPKPGSAFNENDFTWEMPNFGNDIYEAMKAAHEKRFDDAIAEAMKNYK